MQASILFSTSAISVVTNLIITVRCEQPQRTNQRTKKARCEQSGYGTKYICVCCEDMRGPIGLQGSHGAVWSGSHEAWAHRPCVPMGSGYMKPFGLGPGPQAQVPRSPGNARIPPHLKEPRALSQTCGLPMWALAPGLVALAPGLVPWPLAWCPWLDLPCGPWPLAWSPHVGPGPLALAMGPMGTGTLCLLCITMCWVLGVNCNSTDLKWS